MERLDAELPAPLLMDLLDAIADSVVAFDHDGRVTYLNRAAEQTLGCHRAEALGREAWSYLMNLGGAEVAARAQAALAGDDDDPFESFDAARQRWLSLRLQRVPGGLALIARDITASKRDERQRRTEEARRFLSQASQLLAGSLDYHTTLETVARLALPSLADLCVVDIIEDQRLLHVALAHVDPEKEATLRLLRERYQPSPAWSNHPMAEVMRTGVSALFPVVDESLREAAARDAEHLRIMRELNFCSYIIVPLIAHEQTLGTISLARVTPGRPYDTADLSLAQELSRRAAQAIAHARLYQAAQEALKARDQFLSIAAHELKTPVTSIKGNAQFLLRTRSRGKLDDERLARALRTIDERSNHLSGLVSDLLDVSRLRLGQLPLRLETFDLATFLAEIVKRYQEQAEGTHRFACQSEGAPLLVQADTTRLEQVITNLLDNAVKYSPDGGLITVALQRDGEDALARVRDQGIGLPRGTAETIFEPFGRAANAETRQVPGLGLGLFICRQIVERHGGRLWAESDGENQGTTIWLRLPGAIGPAVA